MMKNTFILKLGGLLVVAGLAILLWLRSRHLDDFDAVPTQYRSAVTETDLFNAAVKLKLVNPAATTAPAPAVLSPNQPVRLAMGGLGMLDDAQNRQLADLVTAELTGVQGLELVERPSLDRVLREQQMSLSGFIRAKDAIRVGKLLRADWFLFGTTATANGINSLVVRLVDARTGILRDVGVILQGQGTLQLARELAGFVRECRQGANRTSPRVYLAIGAFEDLSLNNRRADFPTQLRAYLLSAYRKANVTLLEREYVDALLQEVRMDLAGLTEESGVTPQPMQSACWLVTGFYQSFENNGFEVDGVVQVARVFGRRPTEARFHGSPGEALFGQIQQAIDEQINLNAVVFVPSRSIEARSQMEIGKDLFEGRDYKQALFVPTIHRGLEIIENRDRTLSNVEASRRRRNLQEAMRAFQTVMLLEPTNHEARLCLAACLRNPTIGRLDEAREQYRQLMEESVEDKWVAAARGPLLTSFNGEDPDTQQRWYAAAAAQSANPQAKEFFQQQADRKAKYSNFLQGVDRQNANDIDLDLAKTNLLKAISSAKDSAGNNFDPAATLEAFAHSFGTNRAAASWALLELLPEMLARFPERRPELQGAVVRMQVDKNTPIIADLQQTLDRCLERPDQAKTHDFWVHMQNQLIPWCYDNACYPLAEKLVEGERKTRPEGYFVLGDERPAIALGYFQHEQWQDALRIFQCYSNRPVAVTTLGRYWGLVVTGTYAAQCAKKLGIAYVHDPREFEVGKPCLDLDEGTALAADSQGLWIAGHAELRHLDANLKTDLRISLPVDNEVAFNCLCVGAAKVWASTAGAGLVEVDKSSRQSRRFTEDDGLLMNSVLRLHLVGETLWIGYGEKKIGGLGLLALSSRQFKSFMPTLNTNRYHGDLTFDPPDGPPRHPVVGLATAGNGDVLALVSEKGLQRFSAVSNLWETLPTPTGLTINCLAVDGQRLVEGVSIPQLEVGIESNTNPGRTNCWTAKTEIMSPEQLANARTNAELRVRSVTGGKIADKGALQICTLQDARCQSLTDPEAILNPPGTMTSDGGDLWVGGGSYIACVDLTQSKVRKYCYIPAKSVRQLLISADYLWAQSERHLYRMALSDLR